MSVFDRFFTPEKTSSRRGFGPWRGLPADSYLKTHLSRPGQRGTRLHHLRIHTPTAGTLEFTLTEWTDGSGRGNVAFREGLASAGITDGRPLNRDGFGGVPMDHGHWVDAAREYGYLSPAMRDSTGGMGKTFTDSPSMLDRAGRPVPPRDWSGFESAVLRPTRDAVSALRRDGSVPLDRRLSGLDAALHGTGERLGRLKQAAAADANRNSRTRTLKATAKAQQAWGRAAGARLRATSLSVNAKTLQLRADAASRTFATASAHRANLVKMGASQAAIASAHAAEEAARRAALEAERLARAAAAEAEKAAREAAMLAEEAARLTGEAIATSAQATIDALSRW